MHLLARNTMLEAFAIFCGSLVLFTVGLSHQEIIGFESRFYLFALEMWRHGITWFPTTYGYPYPDYPVTTTAFIYGAAKIAGQLNKFVAVFPSATAASVTMATTYLLGALHNRWWGWYAVLLMLLTNTFVMEARTISPDQYIAMVTVLCFYLVYSAVLLQRYKRVWFLPFLFLLGFACRGPIGLVVPAGVVCVFYLLEKDIKGFFIAGFVAVLMLILGCVLLFGAAYHVGGLAFVQDVFYMQVSGRLQDATLPWYFYFVESFGAYALTYPLVLLIMLGLGKQLLKYNVSSELKFIQKLLAWGLVILIGLSVPAGKKIRYVLAFTPALALIAAYLFAVPQKQKYLLILQRLFQGVFYLFPLLFLTIMVLIKFYAPQQYLLRDIPYWKLISLFVMLQGLSVIGRGQADHVRKLIILIAAAMTFVMSYIFIAEPINLALNRTRDFVERVEVLRHQDHAKLVFYQENADALPIKYVINMTEEETPVFKMTQQELLQFKQQAFFVASEENFSRLNQGLFHVVMKGSIGHESVVVFERLKSN